MNKVTPYKLGSFLLRQYNSVAIDDFKKYRRISIRTKGQGISIRDEVIGTEIGTKNQFAVSKSQFLLSKIDAMNGAFGIVPDSCDGAIITGNFWTYNIDVKIISKEYLELLCLKQIFTDFSLKASEGTTNRKYLREEAFLNLSIDLPPLPTQQKIVAKIEAIQNKLKQIQTLKVEQEKEINNLLYSKYIELIKDAKWMPMQKVAPIVRRQVDLDLEKIYNEIGVRSFGRGLFEKEKFKGADLTWQKPFWMKEGDLLFSNIKAWEGAVALIPKQYDNWVGSHRYLTCSPNNELINSDFLLYYILTQEGVEKLSSASPGTADRNRTLNTKMLMNIQVPIPTLKLQNDFVSMLHKFNQIKNNPNTQLTQLLPSLLHKAFNGELV